MLELGDYAETAHTQVGEMVGEYGIDYLLAYGKDAAFMFLRRKIPAVKTHFCLMIKMHSQKIA